MQHNTQEELLEGLQNADVMQQVFSYLPISTVASLPSVSKQFNLFASNPSLWRDYVKRDFDLSVPNEADPKTYYSLLKKFHGEKEIALNLYLVGVLVNSYPTLQYIEVQEVIPPPSLPCFTESQILSLLKPDVLSAIKSIHKFSTSRFSQLACSNKNEFCKTVIEMTKDIPSDIVEYIKSIARSRLDLFFSDTQIENINATLPVFKEFPPNLLYSCGFFDALKFCIGKHSDVINQLANSASSAMTVLWYYQFSSIEDAAKSQPILNKEIQFLEWLIDNKFNVNNGNIQFFKGQFSMKIICCFILSTIWMLDKFMQIKNENNMHETMEKSLGEIGNLVNFKLSGYRFLDETIKIVTKYPVLNAILHQTHNKTESELGENINPLDFINICFVPALAMFSKSTQADLNRIVKMEAKVEQLLQKILDAGKNPDLQIKKTI